MNNLMPCPFCGSENITIENELVELKGNRFNGGEDEFEADYKYILCHGCNMETGLYLNEKLVSEKGNKRAKPPSPQA